MSKLWDLLLIMFEDLKFTLIICLWLSVPIFLIIVVFLWMILGQDFSESVQESLRVTLGLVIIIFIWTKFFENKNED